jgi:hypothetical protein
MALYGSLYGLRYCRSKGKTKKLFFCFVLCSLIRIFAADSDSPQGLEGQILVEKDVYERYLRR